MSLSESVIITMNKEKYRMGQGPSALQVCAGHDVLTKQKNLQPFLDLPASTASSGSAFQAPTTFCVKSFACTSH